jgi:hypothetical protein
MAASGFDQACHAGLTSAFSGLRRKRATLP